VSTGGTGEIEAERNELISKMDPKLLDFIRKRKNHLKKNGVEFILTEKNLAFQTRLVKSVSKI
jgi:hypothetical protein